MDLKGVLVCPLASRRPEIRDWPGMFRGRCRDCKREVWVSASSRPLLLTGWGIVCTFDLSLYRGQLGELVTTPEHETERRALVEAFALEHGVDAAEVQQVLPIELGWLAAPGPQGVPV